MDSARKDDHIEYEPETGRMRSPPRQFFLELTGRCNLTCVHCPVDYGTPEGRARGELPFATFEKLLPWLSEAHSINLNVVGEPLAYSRFTEVLARLGLAANRAHFNTNGVLLTPALARELVARRLGSFVLSIDGLESNEPLRGVPYELLRSKLVLLAQEKKAQDSPFPLLGVAFTLMPRNRRELLPMLVDLAAIGVQAVHVQPLMIFWEGLRDENIYACPGLEEELRATKRAAAELGLEMNVFRSRCEADERNDEPDEVRVQLGAFSRRYGCTDPFYEMKILQTGAVQACSRGLLPGLDVNRATLEEIWNHDWYRELRRRLHARRFEAECASCPYIFGSADNQAVLFRSGVHHSQEHRLRSSPPRPARFAASG
jgi:MoaA/NifB/PqqE/SkfB family radical SAM enzyme